jgi:hypothetical protein
MSVQRILVGLILGLSLSITSFVMASGDRASKKPLSPHVDAKGVISLPSDFRNNMVHLGSWFVPEGGASGFHDVYAEKEAVDYFRIKGVFPDGATLVKELRAASKGDYTTGTGVAFANDTIKQWFVMVKDSKNRFSGNGAWGDGWGWALFKPDNKSKNVVSDYKADCLGCHIPVKEKDWVYTEAYPTLVLP